MPQLSFPDGISGPELVELFKKQLGENGITINFERVIELEYNDGAFLTKTDSREIKSGIVVIASGTRPKEIPELSISKAAEERIFYEIHLIRGLEDKRIAIIGAGDAAFDYALSLSPKNKVIILNRSSQVKCLPLLWERSKKSRNISYLQNAAVKEIVSESDGLLLSCTHNEDPIRADYTVIAIGREPELGFLSDGLRNKFETLTNEKKLYIIGDVKNGIYRQTAISVGDGVRTAMEISKQYVVGSRDC